MAEQSSWHPQTCFLITVQDRLRNEQLNVFFVTFTVNNIIFLGKKIDFDVKKAFSIRNCSNGNFPSQLYLSDALGETFEQGLEAAGGTVQKRPSTGRTGLRLLCHVQSLPSTAADTRSCTAEP